MRVLAHSVLIGIGLLCASTTRSLPLKVLFVLDEFPKFNQPFVLDQILGVIEGGHEVFILADHERYPEMIPHEIQQFRLLERTWYKRLPPGQHVFDIICCNFGQNGCWAVRLINDGKIKGKIVTIFHGADITKLTHHSKDKHTCSLGDYRFPCYTPTMYKDLFKQGSVLLGVCNRFKQRLISLGANPGTTYVHHVGIDCDKFAFKKKELKAGERIRIVTCGRLIEKKGIHFALQALAHVVKEHPNIIFEIIGDGPMRKYLERLVQDLGIKNYVKMHGWKTHEQVAEIFATAHIFVLPSATAKSEKYAGDQEGIPTVLMEAMAMGLPVISTRHSGIDELVKNGRSGYLVAERDVKGLAEKMSILIQNPHKWSVMGVQGRKMVEAHFNINKQNEKLIKLFYTITS